MFHAAKNVIFILKCPDNQSFESVIKTTKIQNKAIRFRHWLTLRINVL